MILNTKANTIVLFCLLLALTPSTLHSRLAPRRLYDVVDFGAKGDGTTLNTKAIQAAIDECAKTGGIVIFPPGKYLTGSLELKSNVELRLETGATVLGSKNLSDYVARTPLLRSYNDAFLKYSLFYAERQKNIAITGRGTIDGQGSAFKVLTMQKPDKYKDRPYVIRFVECGNVAVEDITLTNSASWMQHYLGCDGVTLRGIHVFNHANLNNDMMDIDGCRNVVISGCTGDTDDDGITLKSTSERATENVSITNCIVSSHCNAIKTGTESTGGFRNIVISNIVVRPSSVEKTMSGKPRGISGIALTLVDGGMLDGISISHIVMDGPEVPIFIRLGNRGRKYREDAKPPGIGSLRHVVISDVIARNAGLTGCSITGIEGHPAGDIELNNILIQFSGGVEKRPEGEVKELEGHYPEATMWGVLPSYGLFVRHIKAIRLRDVVFARVRDDARPVIVMDDVAGAEIDHLDAQISPSSEVAIDLENVRELRLTGSVIRGNAEALFRLVGEKNGGITVTDNDLREIMQLCTPGDRQAGLIEGSDNRLRHR